MIREGIRVGGAGGKLQRVETSTHKLKKEISLCRWLLACSLVLSASGSTGEKGLLGFCCWVVAVSGPRGSTSSFTFPKGPPAAWPPAATSRSRKLEENRASVAMPDTHYCFTQQCLGCWWFKPAIKGRGGGKDSVYLPILLA